MQLPTNPDIEVVRFSDSRYERLTSEIRFRGEPVAQVNQAHGKERLEVELFTDIGDPGFRVVMPVSDLFLALRMAIDTLAE